ncbi:MAG: TIGR03790 family protein [Kiritimatiellia bacterium]
MKTGFRLFLFLLMFLPPAAWCLGPHEILILINTNSSDSVRIGETYVRLRRVPEANVVRLGVATNAAMSAESFHTSIYKPALEQSRRRGVAPHILAWVYAPGFPWRINSRPPLSLTGLTFLRGVLSDTNSVAQGSWRSPYFAGPQYPGEYGYGSRSLDVLSQWLGDERPLAAWALAHVGGSGLTVEETGAMLIRGMDSDSTKPEGAFYFVTNSDVRSTAREWQFAGTVQELGELGRRAILTNAMPRGVVPVVGIMMGAAVLDPAGLRFEAGALADHMTSFGAAFDSAGQTKCTVWLAAGAGAAGGTVSEPYAYWTKFPHARLFAHYASGCTALESYYQSLRQPLQYLPMGDPLAAPWKPKAEVIVDGVEDSLPGHSLLLRIRVKSADATLWSRFTVFVDGRQRGEGALPGTFSLAAEGLEPGLHELRVVVRSGGLLRHQAFAIRPWMIKRQELP